MVKVLAPFVLVFLIYNPAHAVFPEIKAFTPPPESFNIKKNIVEVTNLAKIPPQGGRGICYAVTASVFLNAENCRISKMDCKNITPDKIFSPYGLVLYGIGDDPNGKKTFTSEGGSAYNAIINVIYESHYSASLECTSKEKTMPGYANEADGVLKEYALWEDMLKLYKKLSKESKSIDYQCDECTQKFYDKYKNDFIRLKEIFPLIEDKPSRFVRIMQQPTYREFVVRLTVPSICNRAKYAAFFEGTQNLDVATYPGINGETNVRLIKNVEQPDQSLKTLGNYTESMKTIRKVLSDGKVLALEGVCIGKYKNNKTCDDGHTVVLSGVMTVCNNKSQCTDLVKVINSWGDEWQAHVNDGWVLAKPLLETTKYRFGMLTWLVDRPTE